MERLSATSARAPLRDVGQLHTRLVPGFVVDTKLEPGAHIVTFGNVMVVRELIVDDAERRIVWGESPHAFVILRQGAQATEDELKLHVRSALAHFKTPQRVSFVDELPETATGKVQKFVLRSGKAGISRQ